MNRLIEDYLRTRGVRYFRGHHDDEYFYLVDFVVGAYRGKLNVHLEVCDADRGGVQLSITPDRYYPVSHRGNLDGLVERANAGAAAVEMVLQDSCDPRLVGALARGHCRPADAAELTAFVEDAVARAVGFFGAMAAIVPGDQARDILRDAG